MTNARLEELRTRFQENPRRYFAPFANELRKAGDRAQAVTICRTHLAGQPGHVSGHIVLGQALYEAGEAMEAQDVFNAALELDPENLIALRTMGEIAQVNGEFSAARHWYERLLDADPRNAEVAQLLKDIPATTAPQSPSTFAPPVVQAESPAPELLAEAPPALPPAKSEESSPPPSGFHTAFTGIATAWQPRESVAPPPEDFVTPSVALDDLLKDVSDLAGEPVESAPEFPAVPPALAEAGSAAIDVIDLDGLLVQSADVEGASHSEASVPGEQIDAEALVESITPVAGLQESLHEAGPKESLYDAGPEEPLHDAGPPESVSFAGLQESFGDAGPRAPVSDAGLQESFGDAGPRAPVSDAGLQESFTEAGHAETVSAEGAPPAKWPESLAAATLPDESAIEAGGEMPPPGMAHAVGDDQEIAAGAELAAASQANDAASVDMPSDAPAPEIEAELPRAQFAENGFEGGVEAESRNPWLTPSAAYSDLEAAPEDWFEVPAPAAGPEAEVEPSPSEPTVAASEESWFDEVSEAAPEAAEMAGDELWMPDFGAVGGPETAATVPSAELELSADDDALPVPFAAQASATEGTVSPPMVEVESSMDYSADAVVVDLPPAEASLPAADSTAVESTAYPPAGFEAEAEPVAEPMDAPAMAIGESLEAASAYGEVAEVPVLDHEGPQLVDAAAEAVASAASQEYPDPTLGHTPAFTSSIPASDPPSAPFVTETLAELYLQQGFREEALAIYRQLADRDPSDHSLRVRISAIEEGAASDVVRASETPMPPRPTVRAFFSRLAQRAPTAPPRSEADAADVPFAAAASALANLFSASKPGAADEGAASSLSSAFTDPAGRPTRPSDRELSLDHLFRDVQPGGSEAGSGVMMDEFLAAPLPSGQPGASTPSGSAGGAPEPEGADIRQFTAWLEGLRKK